MAEETNEPDYKTLYEEQKEKYRRLKNGLLYGQEKAINQSNKYHSRVNSRNNWERYAGMRDGINECVSVIAKSINEHMKDFKLP